MNGYRNILGLILLILLTFSCKDERNQFLLIFPNKDHITKIPSEIYLGNEKVGEVQSVVLDGKNPTYIVEINSSVKVGSHLLLKNKDFFCQQRLELQPTNKIHSLVPKDTIIGEVFSKSFSKTKKDIDSLLNNTEEDVKKIFDL